VCVASEEGSQFGYSSRSIAIAGRGGTVSGIFAC